MFWRSLTELARLKVELAQHWSKLYPSVCCCYSVSHINTEIHLQEQNGNSSTTAHFPTTNSNKKLSDLKTQQNNCCDQISQVIISVFSWHRWSILSKLKASWERLHDVAEWTYSMPFNSPLHPEKHAICANCFSPEAKFQRKKTLSERWFL